MALRSFSVGGRSAATAATANHAGAVLWNASSTRTLHVTQISWAKTVATADNIGIVRASARGTAGSTVTPAQQNDYTYDAAPPSGALLDLAAYSVQPTLISSTAYLWRFHLPAAVGAGFLLPFPDPISVPPGQGLVILTPPATVLQPADVGFFWME
jgi:hypothetical protein